MEPRVSLITLGVEDVGRARRFYEGLGWRGHEVEETVFFQLGGLGLVLWGRDELAEDAGVGGTHGPPRGVALAQNVSTPREVDEVIRLAEEAGGTVTRRPAATFYGGYAGYFTDPDGHAWEVAHNPGFTLGADGSLKLPFFDA